MSTDPQLPLPQHGDPQPPQYQPAPQHTQPPPYTQPPPSQQPQQYAQPYPQQYVQPYLEPQQFPQQQAMDPRLAAYGGPTIQGPARQQGKGARRWLIPLGTGVLGVIVGSAAAGGSAGTTTASPTITVTAQATGAKSAPPAAASKPAPVAATTKAVVSFEGDGTYQVGVDIKPGTYKSSKPDSGNCYWARLKNDSGQFSAIIANNNSSGQSVVTIRSTDGVFETSGCNPWVKVK